MSVVVTLAIPVFFFFIILLVCSEFLLPSSSTFVVVVVVPIVTILFGSFLTLRRHFGHIYAIHLHIRNITSDIEKFVGRLWLDSCDTVSSYFFRMQIGSEKKRKGIPPFSPLYF